MQMKLFNMWYFVSNCFHLVYCFQKSLHVVTCISTSFLFVTEYYSIVWLYHFISRSSIRVLLGCLYILAIMNNAALNIHELAFVWAYVFNFLGYDCWVIREICLVFWRTTRLFSKVSVPFYVSTSNVWGL